MAGIANKIKTSQDQEGMLRRALERIIQLYTDKSHFVYELLQNAEDAQATCIRFVQYEDHLEVFHDGKPFTSENLQGLCDIGLSDKADNLNQIGEFGVGFKSVFGICDTVKLYSNPNNFRNDDIGDATSFAVEINDFVRPEDISEEKIGHNYTTKFVFPYSVGEQYSGYGTFEELNQAISEKLQNLGITTLLFMKSLESIEYEIYTEHLSTSGSYLLEETYVSDNCTFVSALGTSNNKSAESEISYLKFSRNVDTISSRTIDIAFKVSRKNDTYECQPYLNPYISVYFPTETASNLNFIVQGPFRTTPNRSSIPQDDEDNIKLARMLSRLLKDSLVELKSLGILNLSFIKVLPLHKTSFETNHLLFPMYETVKKALLEEELLPCLNGGYVSAKFAKLSRNESFPELFSDELLTELMDDDYQYKWLPTTITESAKETKQLYDYLINDLHVDSIRPEDLRRLFASNPHFLLNRSDEWLIDLYNNVLSNLAREFSQTNKGANFLTADIIKTTTGDFVAPYRIVDNNYIPNVYLPTESLSGDDLIFVEPTIYKKCRSFFEKVLHLKQPDEFAFNAKEIKEHYNNGSVPDSKTHIHDIELLVQYRKRAAYELEINSIIDQYLTLRCKDGEWRNPSSYELFLPVDVNGISTTEYFLNAKEDVFFVDVDYYERNDLSVDTICSLGVRYSLLTGVNLSSEGNANEFDSSQKRWKIDGGFSRKISMHSIKQVLRYISDNPDDINSMVKSRIIWQLLLYYESSLFSSRGLSRYISNPEYDTCSLIKILNGEGMDDWDGKWIFDDDGDLVSPKEISIDELNDELYGETFYYEKLDVLLGFKQAEEDDVQDLNEIMTEDQKDAWFEKELMNRFGISIDDLNDRFGENRSSNIDYYEPEMQYEFPVSKVNNWDTLRKHVQETLYYAAPVEYQKRLRSVRVSDSAKEAKAYLRSIYRYDGSHQYACQMCHEPCSYPDRAQLFDDPEYELDPMNLNLCPNCHSSYRALRRNSSKMEKLKSSILSLSEDDISYSNPVTIPVGNEELWFAQTHIAEIHELMKLSEKISPVNKQSSENSSKQSAEESASEEEMTNDENNQSFDNYVGSQLYKKGRLIGTIVKVDDNYFYLDVSWDNERYHGYLITHVFEEGNGFEII